MVSMMRQSIGPSISADMGTVCPVTSGRIGVQLASDEVLVHRVTPCDDARVHRRVVGSWAIVLGSAAAMCWLLSYSWLLGAVLPMEGLGSLPVSPWLVAELMAIPLGLGAAVLAGVAVRTGRDERQPGARLAGWGGGLVAVLATLSVLA